MNITFNDVYQRLIPILIDKFGIDESEITHDLSFQDDLGADSLDAIELIMEVEDEFNISIPDGESYKVVTVSDAVICIMKALGEDVVHLSKSRCNTSVNKGLLLENVVVNLSKSRCNTSDDISGCSQLERDMKRYANEVISKQDMMAALTLLSEITGGIAVFGIAAAALTSWIPGMGIPISTGIAYAILRNIASVYVNLPTEERRLIAKCANFFNGIVN